MLQAIRTAFDCRNNTVVRREQEEIMINAEKIKPKVKGKSDFFSWQLYRWAKKRPTSMTIWAGTWNSCYGLDGDKPTLEMWAYGPNHGTKDWVDITDQFWKSYLEIGVCAIHGDYIHNWSETENTRVCTRCKKTEIKQIRQLQGQLTPPLKE